MSRVKAYIVYGVNTLPMRRRYLRVSTTKKQNVNVTTRMHFITIMKLRRKYRLKQKFTKTIIIIIIIIIIIVLDENMVGKE